MCVCVCVCVRERERERERESVCVFVRDKSSKWILAKSAGAAEYTDCISAEG